MEKVSTVSLAKAKVIADQRQAQVPQATSCRVSAGFNASRTTQYFVSAYQYDQELLQAEPMTGGLVYEKYALADDRKRKLLESEVRSLRREVKKLRKDAEEFC